jgi:hypothetical protein
VIFKLLVGYLFDIMFILNEGTDTPLTVS